MNSENTCFWLSVIVLFLVEINSPVSGKFLKNQLGIVTELI